jgi:hypothetical protein
MNNRRTPARILAIRDQIMADATVERECTRCDGHGVRDDNPNWIVVTDKGVQAKLCFRCKGSGREPPRKLTDPLKVRYAVADKLLPLVEAGKVEAIRKERDHQEGASLMWPILVDVFERALGAAERNRSARRPTRHPDADYEEIADEDVCGTCAGSGEGYYEGSHCASCGGSGLANLRWNRSYPSYYI